MERASTFILGMVLGLALALGLAGWLAFVDCERKLDKTNPAPVIEPNRKLLA